MDRLRKVPLIVAAALLVYMPFHIFLSQWLSLYTGGLDVWKVAKDFVLLAALVLTIVLVLITKTYKNNKYLVLVALAVAYGAIHLAVWAFNPDIDRGSALLAVAYNCRILGYALLAWGAVLIYPGKVNVRLFASLLLVVSTLVCVFGIVQYNLPKDVLTHVGYSVERGVKPNFFIDDKPDLPRIMSTLRDPNSLGAFLILPITILVAAWFRRVRDRMLIAGLLMLHVLALLLTFGRGAWLGAFFGVNLFLLWSFRAKTRKIIKKYWPVVVAIILVLIVGIFLMRNQYVVQNVVFHSDESTTQTDSNNLHVQLIEKGLSGVSDKPLGHGPGTAGLVSIHNNAGVLTENYFVQIAYEVGIMGLLVLLAALAFVVKNLWQKREQTLVVALLASFGGLTLMNMLLHTWSNEAVAAEWWLLAGLVMASPHKTNLVKRTKK